MDSPPPCETVCAAINSLYHNPDPKEKERASQWLQALQRSVFGWKVADELLHRKPNMESCYMAAQTLRTKIQNSFHELPAESHASLRDSMLQHVQAVDENTNQAIVTQLCLALADLALLMKWPNAVEDIAARLRGNPFVLLEIFTVLPEEVASRHLRLGANRRDNITEELLSSSRVLLDFLGCIEPRHKVGVIKCFTSWLYLGAIDLNGIEGQPVMIEAFGCLKRVNVDSSLHEAATDCVCTLLVRMEKVNEFSMETNVYNAVFGLREAYMLSVAGEDNDRALNYCRVFTELGETMLLKIVEHPATEPSAHFATPIFDCVLMCCGHPDYDIPDITFPLWYSLSEELYRRNDQLLILRFRPYVERLIGTLCKHCQMEPDSEGVLEYAEDFSHFRMRVTELIKDVVFVVGSVKVFSHMYEVLRSSSTSWESMEASMFVMSAVGRNLVPSDNTEESTCVTHIVEAVLGLPETVHVAVRHTSVRLVGELAEWLDFHPKYLDAVLNWLLLGLQDKRIASEAATALQSICSSCQKHMAPHLQGLVHILGGLDNLALKPPAATGLIKGVALVLSKLPHENIAAVTRDLCALQLGPIRVLLERQKINANAEMSRNSLGDPVLFLDRLAAILRHVNPHAMAEGVRHPCTDVVINEVWPAMSAVCDTFVSDARVVERACRTIRFAVRCLGTQSAPLLEPLVKQMVTLYHTHPHSCFLYLGSILVDEYAHLPVCVAGLLEMLSAFLPSTFRLLVPPETSSNGTAATNTMRDHPDTVDDFFRLNARFLQRAPLPYLRSAAFPSIMDCALVAASLHHRDANASVMKFFFDLLHSARSKENKEDFDARWSLVSKSREQFGAKIVDALVRAVVLSLPSYTYRDVGDVLFQLMVLERTSFCLWLEATLRAINEHSAGAIVPNGGDGNLMSAPHATKKQLVKFHKDVTSAEDPGAVIAAIREFSLLWR